MSTRGAGEGEVARNGQHAAVPDGNSRAIAGDLGLSRKDIHEARQIRDVEEQDAGVVRRTTEGMLAVGKQTIKILLFEFGPPHGARPAIKVARGKA